jgi:hypothetical protein
MWPSPIFFLHLYLFYLFFVVFPNERLYIGENMMFFCFRLICISKMRDKPHIVVLKLFLFSKQFYDPPKLPIKAIER